MAEEIIDIRDRIEKMRIQIENEATEQISVNIPLEAHQKTTNSNISLSIENKNDFPNQNFEVKNDSKNFSNIEQKDLSLPIKDPVDMLGHVTSSYFSPNLNHSVAMALIRGGKRKIGSRLFVSTENLNTIAVEVVEPNFIDPKNERMML